MDFEKINVQIKENMHKAFYDLIDENVNSKDPDYNWITKLYIEIRDRLSAFLKKDSKLHKKIYDEFDEKLFYQMISNDVFYKESMLNLINNTFSWIEKLQAPVRDSYTKEAKLRVLTSPPEKNVSTFLKEVHLCIDFIEEDTLNYFNNKK